MAGILTWLMLCKAPVALPFFTVVTPSRLSIGRSGMDPELFLSTISMSKSVVGGSIPGGKARCVFPFKTGTRSLRLKRKPPPSGSTPGSSGATMSFRMSVADVLLIYPLKRGCVFPLFTGTPRSRCLIPTRKNKIAPGSSSITVPIRMSVVAVVPPMSFSSKTCVLPLLTEAPPPRRLNLLPGPGGISSTMSLVMSAAAGCFPPGKDVCVFPLSSVARRRGE